MKKFYLPAMFTVNSVSFLFNKFGNLNSGYKRWVILLLIVFKTFISIAQPTVTTQPLDFPNTCQPNVSATINHGQSFDLKGTCGNNGDFTFVWQYNNAGTWATVTANTPVGFTAFTPTNSSIGAGPNVVGSSFLKITLGSNAAIGNFQFRCIATYSKCSSNPVTSNIINFTVNSKPVISFIAQPGASACASSSTYTTQPGQSGYLWGIPGNLNVDYTINSMSGASLATSNSIDIKWLTSGSKIVTINYSNSNGCTLATPISSTATTVSVVAPTFTAQPSGTICSSTDVTYTTQAGKSPYFWTYSGVLNTDYTITSGGTSADNTLTLKWLTAGSKTVGVNYTSGGCTAASPTTSSSVNVTTRPTPTFTASAGTPTCTGVNVTYTTQPGQTNYVWSVPGTAGTDYSITGGGIGTASNTVTLKWITTGSKTVTVNYTSSSCTGISPATSTTTVNALPAVSFTSFPGASTCASTDVVYTTQAGQSNYVWTVEGTLGTDYSINGGGVGTTSSTVTIKWLTSGANRTVTVNYTNAGSCAALTPTSVTTFINARPSPTFTTSPDATTCANTDVSYTTQSGQSAYVWSVPGTAGVDYIISSGGIGATNSTVTLQWLTAGVKTVTVNYNNSNNCNATTAVSAVTTVNIPITPTITTGSTPSFCTGGSVTLTSSSATSYQWYKDGVLIGGATSISYSAIASGSYTVKVFNASGCDATSTGTTVTVNPLPAITTLAQATSLCFSAGIQTSTLAYTDVDNSPTSFSITWNATAVGAGFLSVANASLISSPISISVPAGAAANTYTGNITVTNANGCTSSPAKSFGVVITSPPNLSNFGISSTGGCVGTGAAITVNSTSLVNGTYTVYYNLTGANTATGSSAPMVFNAGTGTFLAAALSAGSTDITVTQIALVGCSSNPSGGNTATFNINTLPSVATTVGANKVCIGASTTLTNATSGGLWSSSDITIATVNTSGAVTGILAGAVDIIYTTAPNGSGCTNNYIKTITVNALPVIANITGTTALCISTTSNLDNATAGGSWSSANTSVATINSAGVVSGLLAGNSLITYAIPADANGCTNSTSTTITVDPAATVNAGLLTTVCQSATPAAFALSAATIGGGATTGAWSIVSGGGSLSSTAQTATPAAVNYTPAANYSGPVVLLLTTNAPGSCEALTSIKNITVSQAPTVGAGPTLTVCQSSTPVAITLSGATLGGGAATAAWSTGIGGGTLSDYSQTANPETVTYTPAANYSGDVTLNLITNVSGACAAASTSRTITVTAAPTVAAGSSAPVCKGSSAITLTGATIGGGATSAAWSITSPGGGTLSSVAQTASPSTVTYTPAATFTGAITLTLTSNAPGACSSASTTRIINISAPATAIAAGPDVACQSATPSAITLTGSSVGGGATTGAWSIIGAVGGTLSNSLQTASPSSVTYTPAANYSGGVTLRLTTDIPGGCTVFTVDRTINISVAPTANAGTAITTCSNNAQTVSLLAAVDITTGATAANYNSILWSSSGTGTFTNPTSLSTATYTPSAVDKTAGSVIITLTAFGNSPCGTAISSKTFTITPAIDASAANSWSVLPSCQGQGLIFSLPAPPSGGNGTFNYQWMVKNNCGTAGSSAPVVGATGLTFLPPAGSNCYWLFISSGGCAVPQSLVGGTNRENPTDPLNVAIATTGQISFTSGNTATSICIGGNTAITATSAVGFTYSWSPATGLNTTTGPTVIATPSITTTYTVLGTDGTGCTKSATYKVTVNPLPTATIGGTTTVCLNSTSPLLTFTGANGTAPYTFTYKIGSGANQTVTTVSGNTATVSAPTNAAGTFLYTLVSVQDNSSSACTQLQSGTATITVNPLPTATIGGTTAVCLNSTQPLVTFTGAGGTAPYTFTYKIGSGSNLTVTTTVGNSITVAAPTTASGSFIYTLLSVQDASSTACTQLQSGTATITVDALTVPGTLPIVFECNTGAGGILTLSGNNGSVVKWESSLDNFATAGNSITNTTVTQAYTAVAATKYYRAIVQSGTCPALPSTIAIVGLHNVWTGAANTSNWNTGANWSDGQVASTSCPDVTIPVVSTVYPVLNSGTAAIINLKINSGASLTVSGATLQIAGTITNSGGTFDVKNGYLEFNGSSAQTVSGSLFVENALKGFRISNAAGISISGVPSDSLRVLDSLSFGVGNTTVNTNDNLVLASTATGTSRVADITNNGATPGNKFVGKVTVERFFPASRSWRLITSPLSGAGSVFDNWQIGAPATYIPGNGMFVTGPNPNTSVNGLDYSTFNNYSLKGWNSTNNTYVNIGNTLTANLSTAIVTPGVATNIGYYAFVRGDRRRTPDNTVFGNMNDTRLSSKGYLQTGSQSFNFNGVYDPIKPSLELIGNPYASSVDFALLGKTNVYAHRFYVFDPSLGTVGLYFPMEDAILSPGIFTDNTGVGSTQGNFIQSSQAFFVQVDVTGPATLTFNENDKSSNYNPSLFRPVRPAAGLQSLRIALQQANANGNNLLVDATVEQFDQRYSDKVDIEDAPKFINTNENLGLLRYNQFLAVERRPLIKDNDTIFLQLTRTTQRNYRFAIEPANIDPNVTAFLEDSYSKTSKPLNLAASSGYDFTVTPDAKSSVANRFRIVFKQAALGPLPVTFKTVKAAEQGGDIAVDWTVENELNIKQYEVEKSVDGQNFVKVNTTAATTASLISKAYQFLDVNPQAGNNFYRIRSISQDGKADYSNTVLVKMGALVSGIRIYPNPVTDIIGAEFKHMAAGIYQARLLNAQGQIILSKSINHAAGTSMENIKPVYKLLSGIYQLEITAPDKQITMVKVIVR